jgi:hypothetical protein
MMISDLENASLGLFQVFYLWVKKFQSNFKKLHNVQMKVYKRVILSDYPEFDGLLISWKNSSTEYCFSQTVANFVYFQNLKSAGL